MPKNDIAQILCLLQNCKKDTSSLVYSFGGCPDLSFRGFYHQEAKRFYVWCSWSVPWHLYMWRITLAYRASWSFGRTLFMQQVENSTPWNMIQFVSTAAVQLHLHLGSMPIVCNVRIKPMLPREFNFTCSAICLNHPVHIWLLFWKLQFDPLDLINNTIMAFCAHLPSLQPWSVRNCRQTLNTCSLACHP